MEAQKGRVDELEEQWKAEKKILRTLETETIPQAMSAANVTSVEFGDGKKAKVKDEMSISVPKSRLGEIIEKIREIGYGELISNEIVITLDKGNDNAATELMTKASEMGLDPERKENVNSTSLKKVLKERVGEGHGDDLAFFGATRYSKVTIS